MTVEVTVSARNPEPQELASQAPVTQDLARPNAEAPSQYQVQTQYTAPRPDEAQDQSQQTQNQ
jgi:hypothetical protein